MNKIFTLLLFFLFLMMAKAEGQITFQRAYNYGRGNFIQQTSDSGYVLTCDSGIIKLDQNGYVLWEKSNVHGNSIRQTSDGGYIVAGSGYNFIIGHNFALITKTDSQGDSLWTTSYYDTYSCYGISALPSYAEGYILTYWNDSGTFTLHNTMAATDSSGNTLWQGGLGGGGDYGEWASDVNGATLQTTLDSCYISICHTDDYNNNNTYVVITKVNRNGGTLWQKTYTDSTNSYYPNSISQNADSSYIIGGKYGSNVPSYMYLMKTDKNGDSLWTKIIDYPVSNLQINDVVEDCGGGYMAIGGNNNYSFTYPTIALLLNLDANGDTLWTHTIPGLDSTNLKMIQKTNDNGFILIGSTGVYNYSDSLYVLKTDCLGNTNSFQTTVPVNPILPFSFSIYPNPASSILTINNLPLTINDLRITDVLGNEVYHQLINNSTQSTIDISQLSNGVYFYQLTNNKETFRGKFVKE